MEIEYDATYKYGNTTVHIVAPPPMTQEEIEKILDNFHMAGWAIWKDYIENGGDPDDI